MDQINKPKRKDRKRGPWSGSVPSAIKLLTAYEKVQQILKGEIPTPEVIEIFPTDYCIFACPHCRCESYKKGSSSYMDTKTLEDLLAEFSKRNVKTIELSGGGEPLAHPRVEAFFDMLIGGNFHVGMITNGYKFSESDRLKEQALKCCNWISFSVDAFTDEIYKKVHGKSDISYRKLKRAVSEMVEGSADKDTPRIGIKMLISKLNNQDYSLAIDQALEMGVDYLQFKFLGKPEQLALSDSEVESIISDLEKQIESIRDEPLLAEITPAYRGERKTYQKCLMTYLHGMIDWDGEIYVCAFFEHRKREHSLGNVHNGGFFKHWDSPRHKQVFDSIDVSTCVPNCPMLRYNPVIDFIKTDGYEFKFI